MARLDSMSPRPAFLLCGFLPNYVIVVAAVDDVLQAGLTQVWRAVVLLLFVVVASTGVAIPLLVLVIRREDAPVIYERWRAWLITHGQALVLVILTVVAVVLMAKGVVGLLT
jgi:Sap, sulfolipid-1-addressing protein